VIHFNGRVPWDTSFDIQAFGKDWISTGEITLVQGFKVPADFHSGYTYQVNPGDEYMVPTVAALEQ